MFPFDEESMMFSIDWDSIQAGFEARAEAAGYTGLKKYSYHETVVITRSPIDDAVESAAREMGAALAKSLWEREAPFYDTPPKQS